MARSYVFPTRLDRIVGVSLDGGPAKASRSRISVETAEDTIVLSVWSGHRVARFEMPPGTAHEVGQALINHSEWVAIQ